MDENLRDVVEELRQLNNNLSSNVKTGAPAPGGATSDKNTTRIVAALAALGTKLDNNAKTRMAEERAMERFMSQVDKASAAYEKNEKEVKEAAEANKRAAQSASELAEEQKKSARTVRDTTISKARQELEEIKSRRTLTGTMQNLAGGNVKYQMSLLRVMGALNELGNVGKAMGGFAKGLAQGDSKLTSLNPVIDSLAGALGKLASMVPVIGGFLEGATKLVAEGAKFVVEQLQKTLETFQQLSEVGAITSRGMTGLQEDFLKSGMTLEGYKRVVQENASALAAFGGTVGKGREEFSKFTGSIIDSEAGDRLRRLGYTADSMGESFAGYMALQTRTGQQQVKTTEQLRKGAIEYSLELDQLTKLTGMNRKAIQDQQDAAMSEARFGSTYQQMVMEGREKEAKAMMDFQTMISKMAPEMAQGLRDLASGFVNTDAATKAFTTTSGAAKQIMDDLRAGNIDQITAFQRLQVALKENESKLLDLGRAVGDDTGQLIKQGEVIKLTNARIAASGKELIDSQKEQTDGVDPLTDSATNAQKQMEQLSRQVQNLGFALVKQGAPAVEKFAETLNQGTAKIAKALGIEIPTITTSGAAGKPTAGAATSGPPTVAAARQASEQAQASVEQARANTKKVVAEKGIGSDEAKQARIAEQEARRRAERAFLEEQGAARMRSRGMQPVAAKSAQARPAKQPATAAATTQVSEGAMAGAYDLNDLFTFGGKTGSRANFEKLDEGFKAKVIAAAIDYKSLTGGKIQVNSAVRDISDQQRLWDESVAAGRPGRTPQGRPLARPSPDSPHVRGVAIDIQNHTDQQAVAAFNRQGLFQRVPDDPVHFSARNGGIIPAAPGGRTVLAAEAGLNEAFVPLPDGKRIPVSLDTDEFANKIAVKQLEYTNATTQMLEQTIERLKQNSTSAVTDRVMEGMVGALGEMNDKLEQILDVLGSSNNIQSDLLRYSIT